nr:hypothetical protein [Variovorax sp. PBS-H4]
MQLATELPAASRQATGLFRASTASLDFIRSEIEQPTIRPEYTSLVAHRYSLPRGLVLGDIGQPQDVSRQGSEIPVDQLVMHRRADPAALAAALPPESTHHWLSEPIRHAVRSAIFSPASAAWSANYQWPNSGLSWWASNNAFAQWACRI